MANAGATVTSYAANITASVFISNRTVSNGCGSQDGTIQAAFTRSTRSSQIEIG